MTSQDDEFLIAAVRLLFQRINEGRIHFDAQRVPKTLEALNSVRFDQQRNPILETITSPVRSLANMICAYEAEALEKEVEERERNSPAHAYLGTPVPVNDDVLRKCAEKGTHSAVAFELYKETGTVIAVCAHSYMSTSEPAEIALSREQAICAGLLTRIAKFMVAVAQLSASAERGEVVMALNRSIFESVINLRFLLRAEPDMFDEFIRSSLGPERDLYDVIQRNIEKRGEAGAQPIEERMLKSIDRVARLGGVDIETVDAKQRDWGGNLRERLKAMGDGERYLFLQRIPSHAVHGTWVDLVLHHLEETEGGLRPKPGWSAVDARLLSSAAIIVLQAAEEYLQSFFGDLPELKPMYGRIADLEERLVRLDRAHEEWIVRAAGETPASQAE
jgi:hypothetical protein